MQPRIPGHEFDLIYTERVIRFNKKRTYMSEYNAKNYGYSL